MACIVPRCPSRAGVFTKNNQKYLSFHRFPTDPELRNKWVKSIRKGNNWCPSKYTRICSLHFEDSCFRVGYGRRTLHSTAVPTIFPSHLPPSRQAKVPRKRKLVAKYGSSGAHASTSTYDKVNVNNVENEEQKIPRKRKVIAKYGGFGARASTSTDDDVIVNNKKSDEEQKLPQKRKTIAKYGGSGARTSTSTDDDVSNEANDEEQKVPRKRKFIAKYGGSDARASTSTDDDVIVNNKKSDEEQKLPQKRKTIAKYGGSGARTSTSTDDDVSNEANDEEQKVPRKTKFIIKYDSGARGSTSTDDDVIENNKKSDEEQKLPRKRKTIAKYGGSGARASTSTDDDDDDNDDVNVNNVIHHEEQLGRSLPKINHATQTENHDEPAVNTELLKKTKLLNKYKNLAIKRGRKLKNEQRKCSRYAKKLTDLEIIILSLYKKMESEQDTKNLENTSDTDNYLNKENDRLNTSIKECSNEEETTLIDVCLNENDSHLYVKHNLVNDSDWKCSWSTGGKVFIKKGEGEPAIEIKTARLNRPSVK